MTLPRATRDTILLPWVWFLLTSVIVNNLPVGNISNSKLTLFILAVLKKRKKYRPQKPDYFLNLFCKKVVWILYEIQDTLFLIKGPNENQYKNKSNKNDMYKNNKWQYDY